MKRNYPCKYGVLSKWSFGLGLSPFLLLGLPLVFHPLHFRYIFGIHGNSHFVVTLSPRLWCQILLVWLVGIAWMIADLCKLSFIDTLLSVWIVIFQAFLQDAIHNRTYLTKFVMAWSSSWWILRHIIAVKILTDVLKSGSSHNFRNGWISKWSHTSPCSRIIRNLYHGNYLFPMTVGFSFYDSCGIWIGFSNQKFKQFFRKEFKKEIKFVF